ncbi:MULTISPECIES: AraC family transcriptional regulator [Cyanophyceae]|uniref:helix-turn-helix transcriptional regulator n=1 Tax=Cyanophyceae TaxID=3028117 RepID=UPI001684338E|nr:MULTISPECIES: AraC family transcriptional regulator [Cyanophyceae]MBD1918270.1 helix-turn-helix transcriptional regulator [Phormidium sp. FACHB-77]MBD2031314.1 helix-turn-helix transcriptional regulator [Phormidium sp. FACHB-322]MBD2052381.1 helix-turn-helix transcriptional regulator [Leptolyngbya sp. FACHB-60]
MTITLSQADYANWLDEATCPRAEGEVTAYPSALGRGQQRYVALREGVELCIEDLCLHDDLEIQHCDREHPLEFIFEQIHSGGKSSQRYAFFGSGLAPAESWRVPGNRRIVGINVHVDPNAFRQWIGEARDDLPDLLRPADQRYLERSGIPTAAMQMAVQAILHCPFQGLTQRLYLESKVWELMALLIEDLKTMPDSFSPPALKADDVERIHYASKLLCRQIAQPPTLIELARAVGINDHKLKVGFRQVFGTTVFGYLHEHRMERSRQLLESGDLSVTAAAEAVGFASRGHFAAAFRRKYGVNPGVYVRGRRA